MARAENAEADALARLASGIDGDEGMSVPVEKLLAPSMKRKKVAELTPTESTWKDAIIRYLMLGEMPSDGAEARNLRVKAAKYVIIKGKLYKRGYAEPFLRCLDPDEASYVLREIHEGV